MRSDAGPPPSYGTVYQGSPFYFDTTGVSGGLYVWDLNTGHGAAYYRLVAPITPTAAETLLALVSASPIGGGFLGQIAFDATPSTGGLYVWNGSDYTQVGVATS